jgi:hypothetical protein
VVAASVAQPVRRETQLLTRLEDTPPIAIAGVAVLVGVLLIFGSLVADVNSFSAKGKLLGYWYSVNRSLNFVLVIPIAIYFAANTFTCIRELIYGLVTSGMIVRAHGPPLTESEILDNWHEFGREPLIIPVQP